MTTGGKGGSTCTALPARPASLGCSLHDDGGFLGNPPSDVAMALCCFLTKTFQPPSPACVCLFVSEEGERSTLQLHVFNINKCP